MSVFNMMFASTTKPVDASPADPDPTAPGNVMWTETEDKPPVDKPSPTEPSSG